MAIAVRIRDIAWDEDLQHQVQRSIEVAVDHHSSRIDRISVYLTDLNGPRGGVDKLYQITAEVRGAAPVMILEKGDDLLVAVNRAARRLGYRIGRRIHRRRIAGRPSTVKASERP